MQTRDLTDLFSLAGRHALITGGASGLGLAVAEGMIEIRLLALRVPGITALALSHHERIMEALKAGDPVAARAAMDAHMDQAADIHRQAVLNDPG